MAKVKRFYTNSGHNSGNIDREYYELNGKRYGECIDYCSNGNIYEIKNYVNDIKLGKYIRFYINGNIQFNYKYFNRKINGVLEGYFENGKLWNVENYIDDLLDGECKYFNIDDGKIRLHEIYENGILIEKIL